MTAQQRSTIDQILRNAPVDLGGDGGGFALGSAEGSVGLASSLTRSTGTRAVSVD